VAKLLVRGSGSGNVKGDVRIEGKLRVECKTTKHSSFSVTTEMVRKLEQAVIGGNEIPVIEVELELGKCKVLVLPAWAWDFLMEKVSATG
jgi:hypothetical protein